MIIKQNYLAIRANLITLTYNEEMDINETKARVDEVNKLFKENSELLGNYRNELLVENEKEKFKAVVAEEVRNLAEQSSEVVASIQGMVYKVQRAFDNLSNSGQEVLNYLEDNVKQL